jgi:hypothetical protein
MSPALSSASGSSPESTSKWLSAILASFKAIVFGAVAVSLVAIGVGLGGVIRHTAGSNTALALLIVGGVTLGQLLPAALRQYLPGTAIQAAVTVHRTAGLPKPGAAIAVLGAYATIALAAALMRIAHGDS